MLIQRVRILLAKYMHCLEESWCLLIRSTPWPQTKPTHIIGDFHVMWVMPTNISHHTSPPHGVTWPPIYKIVQKTPKIRIGLSFNLVKQNQFGNLPVAEDKSATTLSRQVGCLQTTPATLAHFKLGHMITHLQNRPRTSFHHGHVAKFPFAKIISPFLCPNTMYRELNRPVLFT